MFLLLIVTGILIHLYLRYLYPVTKWKKHPSYDEYMRDYGAGFRGKRAHCRFCGSTSIKNIGMRNAGDHLRIHTCNHCGKALYRSEA